MTQAFATLTQDFLAPTISKPHTALGMAVEDLNIVLIDPSRTMQTILRSILQQMRPKRLRVHDSAQEALRDMMNEPPDLVLTEWRMDQMSGSALIKAMRHKSMEPLCFIPIIVITGSATRSSVETALKIGAQSLLVKPVSPTSLRQRIEWVVRDERPMVLQGTNYVIDGVSATLEAQQAKKRLPSILNQLRMIDNTDAFQVAHGAGAKDDSTLAEQVASRKAASKKTTPRKENSATLHRLLRQRASIHEQNQQHPWQTNVTEKAKIELETNKSKREEKSALGKWKQLWGR